MKAILKTVFMTACSGALAGVCNAANHSAAGTPITPRGVASAAVIGAFIGLVNLFTVSPKLPK